MNTNKTNRIALLLALIEGLESEVGKTGTLVLASQKHTVKELTAILHARIELQKTADASQGKWAKALLAVREHDAKHGPTIRALKQALRAMFAGSPDILQRLGLAPQARRLTVEAQAEKVKAAQATRTARHTMGKRQKEAVKGVIAAEPPPADPTTTTTTTPATNA